MSVEFVGGVLNHEVFLLHDLVAMRLQETPQFLRSESLVGVDFDQVGDDALEHVGVLVGNFELVEFGVETREVEGVFLEVVVGCEVFEQGSAEDGFADGEDFSLSCLVTLDLAHFQLLEFLGCCVRRSVRR